MSIYLKEIRLKNFRIFGDETIPLNPDMNIFVGDNATGKSTILLAIDMALSGSATKVMTMGLENIMNVDAIAQWRANPKPETLPSVFVELVFEMPSSPKTIRFNGRQHSGNSHTDQFGIRMLCEPNPDCADELKEVIQGNAGTTFPFAYYSVSFSTFGGVSYSAFQKPCKSFLLDSSSINSVKALQRIVSDAYRTSCDSRERMEHEHRFAVHLESFSLPEAAQHNDLVVSGILESFLNIKKGGVSLSNQGEGAISLRKIDSALAQISNETTVVLVEEPENHLSPRGLRHLVQTIRGRTSEQQVFIATHSSYIATRLGLKSVFFVGEKVESLADLEEDTAEFFMRSPNDNLVQFILAKRVLLVEGAAEYILMDEFIHLVKEHHAAELGIWILSLNNLSFKRYFEVGRRLGIKIAAIRDNDKKTGPWYPEWVDQNIQVFSDPDIERRTFEISLFKDNETELTELFRGKDRPLDYMLSNKAEAAFHILKSGRKLTVPQYIRDAILWIAD